MVCRACFMTVGKDTVICGDIQCPADMVKTFNTGGTAAALQIFLKGKRMAKEFYACSLCQTFFCPCSFQCIFENLGIHISGEQKKHGSSETYLGAFL